MKLCCAYDVQVDAVQSPDKYTSISSAKSANMDGSEISG